MHITNSPLPPADIDLRLVRYFTAVAVYCDSRPGAWPRC
jgi:hypothetical protein